MVVGHSCCGGIRALMSMDDEVEKRLGKFLVVYFSSSACGHCLCLTLNLFVQETVKQCFSLC